MPEHARRVSSQPMSEITLLLQQLASGDAEARDRLYTALYPELKRLARAHLARQAPMTLEPAADPRGLAQEPG